MSSHATAAPFAADRSAAFIDGVRTPSHLADCGVATSTRLLRGWGRWGLLLLLGLAGLGSACRTGPPLPKADFSAPGWQVRQGQAVWRRAGAADLSGELLVATHADGSAVVQFAKPPVTLVTAQSTADSWAVPPGR